MSAPTKAVDVEKEKRRAEEAELRRKADELARQKAEELARKAAEEAKRYAELSEEDAENENSEDYADYHLTSTYAREAEDEEARRKENRNRGGKIKLPKRKRWS